MDEENIFITPGSKSVQPAAPFQPPHMTPISQQSQPPASQGPVDPTMATPPTNHRRKLMLLIGVAVFVILLLGGGYFAYAYYTGPSYVWSKFTNNLLAMNLNQKSHTDYVLSYTDKMDGQPLKAQLTMKTDEDFTDAKNPIAKALISVGYTAGATNLSINDIEVRKMGDVLYANISQIPFVGSLAKDYDGWVKLDYSNSNDKQAKQVQDLNQIAKDTFKLDKLISGHTNLGSEDVNGKSYHYQVQINKDELKSEVGQFMDKAEQITAPTPTDAEKKDFQQSKDYTMKFLDSVFSQSTLDIWVGASDRQLHKVAFVMPFYSVGEFYSNIESQSRDASRLADIRQMSTALELYFNDNGGYPAANSTGFPEGLTPMYIYDYPKAPQPADGNCSTSQNYYTYKPQGPAYKGSQGKMVYSNYQLTACIGQTAGGITAGVLTASAAGITGPDGKAPSTGVSTDYSGEVDQFLNSPKTAKFELDMTITNLGQKIDVQAPAKSYDLMKDMGLEPSSSDFQNQPNGTIIQ